MWLANIIDAVTVYEHGPGAGRRYFAHGTVSHDDGFEKPPPEDDKSNCPFVRPGVSFPWLQLWTKRK